MTDDYHDAEGNSRLMTMNARLWRDLPALSHLMDVSFSTHAQAEPILVRGCYFVACGPEPQKQAFAAGLVNGKASKMIADAAHTSWSRGADAMDRRYRLASLGLGLATAAIALPIWFWGIIGRLQGKDVSVRSPAGTWIAGACLGALVLAWAVGLSYQWIGRKDPAKPSRGTVARMPIRGNPADRATPAGLVPQPARGPGQFIGYNSSETGGPVVRRSDASPRRLNFGGTRGDVACTTSDPCRHPANLHRVRLPFARSAFRHRPLGAGPGRHADPGRPAGACSPHRRRLTPHRRRIRAASTPLRRLTGPVPATFPRATAPSPGQLQQLPPGQLRGRPTVGAVAVGLIADGRDTQTTVCAVDSG